MSQRTVTPSFTIPQAETLLELAQEAELEALGGVSRRQVGLRAMTRLISALAEARSVASPERPGCYSPFGPGRSGDAGGGGGGV